MPNIANISNVAYKKGNWMRYTLWALGIVCIGVLIYTFVFTMSGEVSASVPEGYKFSVTDNYANGSKTRTTYYVYDDRILAEDEGFEDALEADADAEKSYLSCVPVLVSSSSFEAMPPNRVPASPFLLSASLMP